MSDICAVFLDLGDTLVTIRSNLKQDIVRRICLQKTDFHGVVDGAQAVEEFDEAVRQEWKKRGGNGFQWVNSDESEHRYWMDFFVPVLEHLGVDRDLHELADFMAGKQADPESFVLFNDVIPTLEYLVRSNLVVGLISNGFRSADRILEYHDLLRYLDPIVVSYREREAKPAKSIYQKALTLAGVEASQSLFVDDRELFVRGAKRAGLRAVEIRRGCSSSGESRNGSISNLHELEALLSGSL